MLGPRELGPATSMSHPNAAMLQSGGKAQPSQSRSDTSSSSSSSRNGSASSQAEGSPEGTSDAGSKELGPATSMSHPNAAMFQSRQVRRDDTSASDDSASSSAASNSGFDPSPRVQDLIRRVTAFMQQHIYPSEHAFEAHAKDPATKWKISPLNEQLKLKAKAAGLWNLWLPADLKAKLKHLAAHAPAEEEGILLGAGLSNLVRPLYSTLRREHVFRSDLAVPDLLCKQASA